MNTKLAEIWSQVPADYFSTGVRRHPLQRLWHTGKLNAVSKMLDQQTADRLVEVGSADGSFVYRLKQSTGIASVVAVDPYLPPLRLGKRRFSRIDYIQADAHSLPFRNETVDVVTILETLEHVSRPLDTLMELKRILKRDGRIVVEMDSGSLLFQVIWFFWKQFGKGRVWKGSHLTFFNVSLLKKLFKKANLKVEKEHSFNLGMGVCYLLKK